MSATVIVNNLTVVHKRSGGTVTAAPDVCKTPSPGGPVPVPYTNTAFSADTAAGSRSLTVDGQPIMLKSSHFSTSTGDEPGSLGGVVSGKFKGKAYPRMYSFDVKVEGQNVFRLTDIMLQNGGSPTNTPPGVETQANAAAAGEDPDKGEVTKLHWAKTSACCGDKVQLQVKTTNVEDGKLMATRFPRASDPKSILDSRPIPIKGDQANFPWVTYRRSYRTKVEVLADQRSFAGVECSDNKLELKTVADAKELIGPFQRQARPFKQVMDATGAMVWQVDTSKLYGWEVCYEIAIKSGQLIVTRKIDFDVQAGVVVDAKIRRGWKTEIEGVWDRQFRLHRTNCKRGKSCDCGRSSGCCVYMIRVRAQWGAGHGMKLKLFSGAPLGANWGKVDLWWYSHTWWTQVGGASTTVRGHEFGHLIGRYDEYAAGACNPAGANIDIPTSIMNAGKKVLPHHFSEFKKWFEGKAGVVGKVTLVRNS